MSRKDKKFTGPKNCLNCLHHGYSEDQDEIEHDVCFQRRKLITDPRLAANCSFYQEEERNGDVEEPSY